MGKEIQNQRFKFFNEERQNNINRCIEQRRELIMLTKKNKGNKYKNKDKLGSLSDNDISVTEINNTTKSKNLSQTKSLLNSQTFKISNYKVINEKDKKIYITENSYIMTAFLPRPKEVAQSTDKHKYRTIYKRHPVISGHTT